MKIKFNLSSGSAFLLLGSIFFLSAVSVQATVGGETLISTFKYNPTDESVYYIRQSSGGRGCPPELMKIGLNSEKIDTLFSCSDGEKLGGGSYDYISPASLKIKKIIEKFKDLTPLNLKDIGLQIDVNFVRAESYSSEIAEIVRRHFVASVYQNNKKIDEFAVVGCSLNQPFLFQGYAIPGFEKKIIILTSAKGDCFEGGYINETLSVVGNVSNLNKTGPMNFYKGMSPLVPNEGNLTVFEADKLNTPDAKSDFPTVTVVIISLACLFIGGLIGRMLYKKI